MLGKIVSLVFACVVIGAVAPTAVTAIVTANTTGWGTANIALWGVAGIAVVIGLVVLILKESGVEM